VSRIPIAPHAEVVTAGFVIEIVVEAAELSVLKAYARETGATDTPFFVAQVIDFIADPEIETLAFGRRRGFVIATMEMF